MKYSSDVVLLCAASGSGGPEGADGGDRGRIGTRASGERFKRGGENEAEP